MSPESYNIKQRKGNVLIVRVFSKPFRGQEIPDTVFTFRPGDPQYELWNKRYIEQTTNKKMKNLSS